MTRTRLGSLAASPAASPGGMRAGLRAAALNAAALNAAALPAAALLAAGGPMTGRREGQRLARSELAEMSFWQRIGSWFARLFDDAGLVVPGGWFGLIALAILGVLAVAIVLNWARPSRTRRAAGESVLAGEPRTARDYRRAAERLADDGDYAGAIIERVRAIAAELDERAILPPRPGRTADELAVEAGRELPGLAAGLQAVTRLFDDVRYGDKAGSLNGYQLVSRVDKDVQSARPTAAWQPEPALAGFGVPQ